MPDTPRMTEVRGDSRSRHWNDLRESFDSETPRMTERHLRALTSAFEPAQQLEPRSYEKESREVESVVCALASGRLATYKPETHRAVSVEELESLQKFMREHLSISEVSQALNRWLTPSTPSEDRK